MGWFSRTIAAPFQRRATSDFTDATLIPSDDSDYWFTDYGASSAAGVAVTPDSALRNSAIWSVIKVITDSVASSPIQMFKMMPQGGLEPAPTHPLNEIIQFQANGIQTALEFWETMLAHAALRGVAYAQIKPGPRGAVDRLVVMHPDRVKPELLADGSLRFRFTDPRNNETKILLQEEVFRLPGLTLDGWNPLRPTDVGSDTIGLAVAADEYAGRVFSQNLNMGGFLVHPGKMSPDATRRLISRLTERFAGRRNFHRPMILQDGIKYEKASMTAAEAQLGEARLHQTKEIARRWHVPLHMLGIDETTNRATVEEQSINFVRYTLRPWCTRIQLAIRRDLIIAKQLYTAKYDLDDIERGNSDAQGNYYSKALGAGGSPPWMTQNEVRMKIGLNRAPEPHADELAMGTNPAQGAQQADAAPAPKKKPAAELEMAPKPLEIEDHSPESRSAKLANKECKAVRNAAMRYAADIDAFRNWVKAFYGGHVSDVILILGISREHAKQYCSFQVNEVLEANDLYAVLDRRDETLEATILAALKVNEASNG